METEHDDTEESGVGVYVYVHTLFHVGDVF